MLAAELAQGRVIAHAMHELRGTMTTLELCLTALERDEHTSAKCGDLAAIIRAQVQRGLVAIEDVEGLQLRRSTRAAAEPVEVGLLVARRERAWRRLAELSGARMEVVWLAGRAFVVGDARRLCQALDNLVSNSIRHGRRQIVLSAQRRADTLMVELRDGGSGPSARQIESGGSLASEHGHGLSIARLAVESCGGSIAPVDGGVAVRLPLQRRQRSGQVVADAEPSAA